MKRDYFFKGVRASLPIALGYYAVSVTIGIAAAESGLTVMQAGLLSLLNFSSAGEFAGFSVIAAAGSYIEAAVMQLIINARYLLMSAVLSQKLKEGTTLWERLAVGLGVTDEIFGISVNTAGELSPYFSMGAIALTIPAWTAGTMTGAVLGNILPQILISAFSVSLYGMFIAAFIPPARKSRIIAVMIFASFLASYIFNTLSVFDGISSGTKIIILTAAISAIAAAVFPIKEEE